MSGKKISRVSAADATAADVQAQATREGETFPATPDPSAIPAD
jgi:hypothetical protein